MISYETVRRWVNHFGPIIAAELRKRRPRPHSIWHLDEVYLKIDGRMVYLWRAVNAEGEVLDVLVQSKRNKHAALKLMRKLLRKYAVVPDRLVTDDLRSYRAATLDLGIERRHERGQWKNNRAENSHQPNSTAGAQDATLQERGLSPEVSLNPCRTHQAVRRGVYHEPASVPCTVLHTVGKNRSRALLAKVHQALTPGGTLAIAEFLVDEARATQTNGLIFAVNMLVNTEAAIPTGSRKPLDG